MMRTITALFDSLADADCARDRLIDAGIGRDRISIIAQPPGDAAMTATPQRQGGFFADLANLFLPDDDRYAYEEGIRRGGQLLTVRTDDADVERLVDIIQACGPVDIDRRAAEWRNAGWQGFAAAPGAARTGREEVIPIVEEQLRVGKREITRGGVRVHSHIVEQPIEEQVNLREEHVTVERRPVNRPVTGDPARLLQEREIEMTESGEEAVVSKEAVVREELVLRKDVEQRTETVRDTVRRTEVDVDKNADRGPRRPLPRDAAE